MVDFVKLTDPADAPGGAPRRAGFSPGDTYLAVPAGATPYLTIYKRSGLSFTKISGSTTQPAGTAWEASFSDDDQYLAVAHQTSPYITIYKRSGDTFTKLADPASLPGNAARGCAWSPGGAYLAVCVDSTSPYLIIYKREGDTFTKLSDPADLPGAQPYGAAWSPDGVYLAVASKDFTPYLTIYKRTGDTFAKLAQPDTQPASKAHGCAFSRNGDYLAVASDGTGNPNVYKRSGDTFTKLTTPAFSNGKAVAFSADNKYLASIRTTAASPIAVFERSGDTFTQLSGEPATFNNTTTFNPRLNFGERFMVTGHDAGSPAMAVYSIEENVLWAKLSPATSNSAGGGQGQATLGPATARFNPLDGMHMETDAATAAFTYGGLWQSALANTSALFADGGQWESMLASPAASFDGFGVLAAFTGEADAQFGVMSAMNIILADSTASIIEDISSASIIRSGTIDLLPGNGVAVDLTPDGANYMAAALAEDVATYKKVSGTPAYARLATSLPDDNNTNAVRALAFTQHDGGAKLAVGHLGGDSTNRAVVLYDRTGDSFAKDTAFSCNQPTAQIAACEFSTDGDHLVLGTTSSLTGDHLFWYKKGALTYEFHQGYLSNSGNLVKEVRSLSWSPSGTYLAAAVVTTTDEDKVFVLKKIGDAMSIVETIGVGSDGGVAFSDDENFLAIGGDQAPYLRVYARSGDDFTLVDPFANEPAYTAPTAPGVNHATWNHDGTSVAVCQTFAPYLLLYNRVGDRLVSITAPAELPASSCMWAAWNHDGTSLAVAPNAAGVVMVYNRSGDTFTKIADPPSFGGSIARAIDWNPDGTSLAVAANVTGQGLAVYNRVGDVFGLVDLTGVPPADAYGLHVDWNHDGTSLAVSYSSQFVHVYSRSGDTFTDLGGIGGSLSGGTPRTRARWSRDGSLLARINPFVRVLKRTGDTFVDVALPTPPNPSGLEPAEDVSWNQDASELVVAGTVGGPVFYRYDGAAFTLHDAGGLRSTVVDSCNGVEWSRSGRHLLFRSTNGIALVERTRDGYERLRHTGIRPMEQVKSLAWSDESPMLVYCDRYDIVATEFDAGLLSELPGPAVQPAYLGVVALHNKIFAVQSSLSDDFAGYKTLSVFRLPEDSIVASTGAVESDFYGYGRISASTDPALPRFNPLSAMHLFVSDATASFAERGRIRSTLAPSAGDMNEMGRLIPTSGPVTVGPPAWRAIVSWVLEASSQVATAEAFDIRHAWNFRDAAGLFDQVSSVGQFVSTAVDQLIAADKLLIVRDFLLTDGITIADLIDENRSPVAVIVDAMIASDVATSVHQAVMLLASALALNESAQAALTFNVADAITVDDELATAIALNATLLSQALLASALNLSLSGTATLIESPQISDALTAGLVGTSTVSDAVEIDAVLLLEGIPYAAWVVNTESGAPSEYRNWNFESMCRLGDRYYGASESGLFLLEGDDDAGSPIEASFKTGDLDFGSPQIKRPLAAHIGYTAQGDMVLKVTVAHEGKRSEYWYLCKQPVPGTATEARMPIGKGLASRHWQFELVNTKGADFEFEAVNLQMLELGRRL